jgi:hypothetical protein
MQVSSIIDKEGPAGDATVRRCFSPNHLKNRLLIHLGSGISLICPTRTLSGRGEQRELRAVEA